MKISIPSTKNEQIPVPILPLQDPLLMDQNIGPRTDAVRSNSNSNSNST